MLAWPPRSLPGRPWLIPAALAGLAVLAVFTVTRVLPFAQPTTTTQDRTAARPAVVVQTAPAQAGTMSSILSYAGLVQPSQQVSLVPKTAGLVQALNVDVGTVVHKGDVIATLDQDAARASVQQAQAGVQVAQAKLAQVQSGARAEDVAAAQAQVAGAQAKLQSLLQGRNEDVNSAQAALDAAQAKLDLMQQGGRPEAIAQAQANLDAAQQKLVALKNGATPDKRQAALSQLNTARSALQAAQTADANVQTNEGAALAARDAARTALQQNFTPTASDILAAQNAVDKANSDVASACKSLSGDACDAATRAAQSELDLAQAKLNLLKSGGTPVQQAQVTAALAKAEGDLKTVQTQRANLDAALAKAQEDLKTAQANYDQILAGPLPQDVAQAQDAVTVAQQQLALAQNQSTDQDIQAQQDAVSQAQQALTKALQPGSPADIAQQQQVIAQLSAQLQKTTNPYTDTDLQSAAAGVAQAQAQLALAQAGLDQTTILAPFDGVITQKLLSPGAFASSSTPVVAIATPSNEIHITVEEARIGQILPNQLVQFTLPAYPGVTFQGKVVTVAPGADARAHTFDVKIVGDGSDDRVKPGMYAQVSVTAARHDGAVLVPREAVVQQGNQSVVFVVQDGKASAHQVQTGLNDDKNVEIVSGVSAGDQVVVIGQNGLRDGQNVTTPNARQGAGGQGQSGQNGQQVQNPGSQQGGRPGQGGQGATRQGGGQAGPQGQNGSPAPANQGQNGQ